VSETGIRLRLGSDGTVLLESDRDNRLSTVFCGREAADIIGLIPAMLSLCPAAHVCAFSSAFETAESGLAIQNISILTRIEALLETIRFFSMDLRRSLGLPGADKSFIGELAKCRTRLSASLQGQSDTTLMVDTLALAQRWLDLEVDFFKCLLDQAKALEKFTLPAETILTAEELSNTATLTAMSMTLKDCPDFALHPRLGGARVLGAISRRPLGKKRLLCPADFFRARINEVASLVSGGSSTLGAARTFTLGLRQAVCLVETARGLLIYFVKRERNTATWVNWIAPTEWVFQNRSCLTTLASEAYGAGATSKQIALIASAFDACAEVSIVEETSHA